MLLQILLLLLPAAAAAGTTLIEQLCFNMRQNASGTMDNNDNDHVVPLRQDREDALPRVAGLFCEISAARVFAW